MSDTARSNSRDGRPPRPVRGRRLDEVFGDVLPETTRDERDPAAGQPDRESWYRENRPPHHDRD